MNEGVFTWKLCKIHHFKYLKDFEAAETSRQHLQISVRKKALKKCFHICSDIFKTKTIFNFILLLVNFLCRSEYEISWEKETIERSPKDAWTFFKYVNRDDDYRSILCLNKRFPQKVTSKSMMTVFWQCFKDYLLGLKSINCA